MANSSQSGVGSAVAVTELKEGIAGELITWGAAGIPTVVGAGLTGQVLTSNGAGDSPTFQAAAGGGVDKISIPLVPGNTGTNVSTATAGSGTVTVAGDVLCRTSTTDASAAFGKYNVGPSLGLVPPALIFNEDPSFSCFFSLLTTTGNFVWQITSGSNALLDAASTTLTAKHFGFVSDTLVCNASNANGTTQTKTDISSGLTFTQQNAYTAVMTGTTDVKFYVNNTLKATHTTNLPTGAYTSDQSLLVFGGRNDSGDTTDRYFNCHGGTLSWNVA